MTPANDSKQHTWPIAQRRASIPMPGTRTRFSDVRKRLHRLTAALAATLAALVAGVDIAAEPAVEPSVSTDTPASVSSSSDNEPPAAPTTAGPISTVDTLQALISVRDELRSDIRGTRKLLLAAATSEEKQGYLDQLEKLSSDLDATQRNLQEIAAGADVSSLRAVEETKFDFQQELFSLLEPAIKEMKDLTSDVRQKSQLRDKINYFSSRVPITETAIANLEQLLASTDDPSLTETLTEMLTTWRKQDTFLRSELKSAELQFNNIVAAEASLAETSQSYLKSFFQNRGRVLGQAILVIIGIIILAKLTRRAMERFVPGYQTKRRSLQVRLLDLSQRILAGLLAIIGPMVIFYLAEDWLLFSLGILILLGIGLALREAIPRYWQQVQLFLNIGTVREGERLDMDGLPWLVQQINVYTMLENPTMRLVRRVKIDDLVDLRSRPVSEHEPWFPCRYGDWVLLNDGVRGRVVGLSVELVELVQRGGAHKGYSTAGFIGREPTNLSANFRIKETVGISYALQPESVSTIPGRLQAHIERRLREEGYESNLLNLRVEFERANTSSLDLVAIADFDGEVAELYNRLRRALQRFCVEACEQNGWEIPFTQVTLHQQPTTS